MSDPLVNAMIRAGGQDVETGVRLDELRALNRMRAPGGLAPLTARQMRDELDRGRTLGELSGGVSRLPQWRYDDTIDRAALLDAGTVDVRAEMVRQVAALLAQGHVVDVTMGGRVLTRYHPDGRVEDMQGTER